MKTQDFKDLNFSLLGCNSTFKGDFTFKGDTYLNCRVEGNINLEGTGKLIIERNAVVEADIFCNDIDIFGDFKGTITANGTLTAKSSATISGKISANKISILPGASINMEGNTQED